MADRLCVKGISGARHVGMRKNSIKETSAASIFGTTVQSASATREAQTYCSRCQLQTINEMTRGRIYWLDAAVVYRYRAYAR